MNGQKIKDLTIRYLKGIHPSTPLHRAWDLMIEKQVKTLPVVDQREHLIGLITMHDITLAYIKDTDTEKSGDVVLPLKNVLDTVNGTVLANARTYVSIKNLLFTSEKDYEICGEETVIQSRIPEETIRRILVRSFPVELWMKKNDFLSVRLEEDVIQCARRAGQMNYRYFPVLDGDGRVAGIISREELLFQMDKSNRVKKGYCNVPE